MPSLASLQGGWACALAGWRARLHATPAELYGPWRVLTWREPAPAAQVAKRELALECDYGYEARCQSQFRRLIAADPSLAMAVSVPYVVEELSTPRLLTSEWVPGVHIDKARPCERSHLLGFRV